MLAHKINLTLEFGELDSVMSWCREHCSGDWRLTDNDSQTCTWEMGYGSYPNSYKFEFEEETDFITFSLKYK